MTISLKDSNTRKIYSTHSGKPIIQVLYKHEHQYIIYQEVSQNISEKDLSFVDKTLKELKKLCRRRGYSIYDFNDMQAQLLARSKETSQDGKQYLVTVKIRDMVTGDIKHIQFAMIGDPTAEKDAPAGVVE